MRENIGTFLGFPQARAQAPSCAFLALPFGRRLASRIQVTPPKGALKIAIRDMKFHIPGSFPNRHKSGEAKYTLCWTL